MASSTQHVLLSPAELAYLHASLSLTPPVRPDGRTATQFRPLVAETGILPGTNGSARICFADGTEAIVGVKAEVERTRPRFAERFGGGLGLEGDVVEGIDGRGGARAGDDSILRGEDETASAAAAAEGAEGEADWLELSVEIPGYREDDSGVVFLSQLLSEALIADGGLVRRLVINSRFHWKVYLDVSLIMFP